MTQPMTKPTQPVTQQQTPTRIQEVSTVETDLFDLLERLEQSDVVPCRVHDAEIWFAQTPEDVDIAKALCGTCPARDACLSHALDSDAFWGIWGGESSSGERSCPRSGRADDRARRPWRPEPPPSSNLTLREEE